MTKHTHIGSPRLPSSVLTGSPSVGTECSSLAMPFRPALPMNRAVFHRLGLSVGIAIALAGCQARDDGAPRGSPTESIAVDRSANIRVWRDPKTGCEYLIISEDYPHLARAAMTPRLRSNGEPYCPAEGLQ